MIPIHKYGYKSLEDIEACAFVYVYDLVRPRCNIMIYRMCVVRSGRHKHAFLRVAISIHLLNQSGSHSILICCSVIIHCHNLNKPETIECFVFVTTVVDASFYIVPLSALKPNTDKWQTAYDCLGTST